MPPAARPGQRVEPVREAPGFKQGGYDYRAASIVHLPS